jgi:hypothetical protein
MLSKLYPTMGDTSGIPHCTQQVVDPDNQPLDESIEGSVYLKYSYAEKPDETK